MNITKKVLQVFALLATLTALGQNKKTDPVIIEGKVIAESTGRPISRAHVYVLDGEEEALTNNKGEFKIKSWQKIPLKLTVETYSNYQKKDMIITDPLKKQIIRLKIKS